MYWPEFKGWKGSKSKEKFLRISQNFYIMGFDINTAWTTKFTWELCIWYYGPLLQSINILYTTEMYYKQCGKEVQSNFY